MLLKKSLLVPILLLFSAVGFSQNMEKGFEYLETGNYVKAKLFFETILQEHPNQKTARLCFGRAVGLSGNSSKAVSLFKSLLEAYPNDYEIQLNYAESLLWNSQFQDAKAYYEKLIGANNQSFSALLGYANAFSNLKQYKEALQYVDKALEVQPGNKNALISKKYIRLGLADTHVKNQNYNLAESILFENLQTFENDNDTLLNLANLYLVSNQTDKALETYKSLGKNPKNKLLALNGIALTHHLIGHDKKALATSTIALKALDDHTKKSLKHQTIERYIQTLIWNKKFSKASEKINALFTNTNNHENWMLSLRATLNIYKSNFNKSIDDYNRILINDEASFDGNLGKANAFKALNHYDKAYESAKKTLSFYDKQKDAVNFIKTLDRIFTPFIDIKTAYSFDNGENKAYAC